MANDPISAWLVRLTGHQFDLEDLPLWLAHEPIRVVEREAALHLSIPVEVAGSSYEPVRGIAEEHLQLINGAARLLNSGSRPITLMGPLLGVDATGRVLQTVLAVEPVETREKAGAVRVKVGDRILPDPREAAATPILRAARRSPRARDAIILVSRSNLTWSELYLLFELVQADIGGRMYDLGWIPSEAADLFTRTANSYTALRRDGRHGRDQGSPPASPMSHGEAVALVRELVRHWIETLGAEVPTQQAG